MKILMAGDIVGSAGRKVFAAVAGRLRANGEVDFIVANAENAAGGKGLTRIIANDIFESGADVITLGDHTWDQKEITSWIDGEKRVLRPANFPQGCPGRGSCVYHTALGDVMVVNLAGRVFMQPRECPFRTCDDILEKKRGGAPVVIIDFHAEATSEKVVLGRYIDGRASCFFGTHTHVQTSDEKILPGGTGYITDAGMTGVQDGAIGRDLESVTRMFLTGMPAKFEMAKGAACLEGVLAEIDRKSGKCVSIRRIRECA